MAERKTYTAEDFEGCNGRRVLVEGVVEEAFVDEDGDVRVCFVGNGRVRETAVAYVSPSAIVEILPEEIKVGDTVKWAGSVKCTVRAIDDGHAWVRDPVESYIVPLDYLTLVERGQ